MDTPNYPNINLDKFLFSKSDSPDTLSGCIDKYGFAIIPDFLSIDESTLLSIQFDEVQNGKINGIVEEKLTYRTTHYAFSHGLVREIEHGNRGLTCFKDDSIISKITQHPLLKHIVHNFYQKNCEYLYPSRYQFMDTFDYPPKREDRKNNILPYDLHFDRQQLLKFFLYTTDVSLESGPLVVIPDPKVISKNKEIQKTHRLTNASWEEVEQFLEMDESLEIPAIVPKGSLVILDSDVPHRQAQVSKNSRRKCMVIEAQTVEEALYTKNLKLN